MNVEQDLYTIPHFSASEFAKGAMDMNDLIEEKVHGFVLHDFLSSSETQTILNAFKSLPYDELVHIQKDFDSYPISFAQFEQMSRAGAFSESDYIAMSSAFINSFAKRFGVDVFSKLSYIFSQIKNGPALNIAPVARGNSVPFTFRELYAGEGCLKAHCENLFFKEFPGLLQRIQSFSMADHQLSFFIVLQQAGEGGELTLFDIQWDEKQQRPTDHEIILAGGQQLHFDETKLLRRDQLNLPAGSLIVFSGGKIWHRVETVRNAPSRITLGGFLSFSNDLSKLYSWS